MTPERYRQIDELLEQALELEPERREAFLEQACGDDEEMRRRIAVLLSSSRQVGGFLDKPALDVAAREIAQEQIQSEGRLLVGHKLGHFQILALIGAGGMGEVYRARDTRLNREVAIKVLPPHLSQDTPALARFEREAQAVAALSHPNILAIQDFGAKRDIVYAVMELLDGQTLRQRLSGSPLGWPEAVEIGVGVAEGLAAAHAKGVIHRDLKPENIFLTSDGRVKILDFGLARTKSPMSKQSSPVDALAPTVASVTEPGTVMGAAGYMSPEQARGEEADAPSDVFAFGCVLYELVTSRRAFARPSLVETIAAVLQVQPPQFAELGKVAPAELELIVTHCLEKKAEDRFQSASDLSFALRSLLSGSKAIHIHPRSWPRVAAALWGLIAIILLAALSLAILYFRRAPTDAP